MTPSGPCGPNSLDGRNRPGASGALTGAFRAGAQGLILQEKQSLSALARRLAGQGVFPYNTAPAPPAWPRR
jgi:hypothetical protein